MREQQYMRDNSWDLQLSGLNWNLSRKTIVGVILMVALLAFEIFNFDTTQYALRNLLGDVKFIGLYWASILAIAFCSIDFAGLVHLFTPERLVDERKEVWYLMGAWLLGATMNAMMTWWAISLTLLNHNLGNEVLTREQLLFYVPIFVAVLVWLTRILFIGAFTVAGDHIFEFNTAANKRRTREQSAVSTMRNRPIREQRPVAAQKTRVLNGSGNRRHSQAADADNDQKDAAGNGRSQSQARRRTRVRQRPPVPNGGTPYAGPR